MSRVGFILLVVVGASLATEAVLAADLAIEEFIQVSSQRVGRHEFEYVLRAQLRNSGPAVTNVGAVVTAQPAHITVVDGALGFGDVAAGAAVVSQDTFIIRVDRRFPSDPKALIWNITAEPAQRLIARFRIQPAQGDAPLRVTFLPEPVTDTAVQSFEWDFDGDGRFDARESIGGSQTYTYGAPGVYAPRLQVTDSRGARDVQSLSLTVGNAPPLVSALVEPSNGPVPLSVAFSGSASDNEGIARYEWDFDGDGNFDFSSPNTAAVTYTYLRTGNYRPALRVTDSLGAVTIFQGPVTEVRGAPAGTPTVRLEASPASGSVPLRVAFTATATHPEGLAFVEWAWDFDGDGRFDRAGADASAGFTFDAPGVYDARVRVRSADGAHAEDVVRIVVAARIELSRDRDTLDPGLAEAATIKTVLGGATRVSLVIEDGFSQVIRTLVPWGERPAGTRADAWMGETDAGGIAAEGPYYAVLLYETDGRTHRLDLSRTSGGVRSNPPRTSLPGVFAPFAGEPLTIDFTLDQASEVTAFIGRYNVDARLVTFMQRTPLGRGTHRITWNGESGDGQLIHPGPGDAFLFGMFAYTLPDNAIYVRSGAHVSRLAVTPSIFDPAGVTDADGTPQRSRIRFRLSRPASVELTVSDADSGKTVARRLFRDLGAGEQLVHWNGRDDNDRYVAPGRYRLGIAAIDARGFRSLRLYALQRVFY